MLDVVKIYIMPPVTRIIQGSEDKEFLNFLQIKRWFSARNISTNSIFGSDNIGSRIVAVFELGDPAAIEVILDWVEYCGGITDGIASR